MITATRTPTLTEVRRVAENCAARAGSLGAQLALADDVHTELIRAHASPETVKVALARVRRLDTELVLALAAENRAYRTLDRVVARSRRSGHQRWVA